MATAEGTHVMKTGSDLWVPRNEEQAKAYVALHALAGRYAKAVRSGDDRALLAVLQPVANAVGDLKRSYLLKDKPFPIRNAQRVIDTVDAMVNLWNVTLMLGRSKGAEERAVWTKRMEDRLVEFETLLAEP
jgi:hypothetical protein